MELMIKFTLDDKGKLSIQEKGKMPIEIIAQGLMFYCSAKCKASSFGLNKIEVPKVARDINQEMFGK